MKVSPEMKHAENFLFSISGGTCSRTIADQGYFLYIVSKCQSAFLSKYTRFSVHLTIVFFTHSLSTYQNYKVIFLNIWYKKLHRGICWAFVSLLLDGSFWSIDLLWKTFDLLATGSLRATASYTKYWERWPYSFGK